MKNYEDDKRVLAQQNANRSQINAISQMMDIPDVEMELVGSRHSRSNIGGPLDLGFEDLRRPLVAAAEAMQSGGFTTQRIRVSAIANLKKFTGRDRDEDRARSWISKVKSAFLRDQAPDNEKCLVFGDLLTGPARNWYSQLSRSTRHHWKSLLESFMIQYGGYGVSVGRQYYHARKQSNETPLEYLYRLNVAAIRAKILILEGTPATRREHMELFIETLDDRDLAKQLTLLRLDDADDMEETLRAYQRMEILQDKASMGSNKFRQRAAPAPDQASSKPARAVRAIHIENGNSGSESESSGSKVEVNRRRVFPAMTHAPAEKPRDYRDRQNVIDQGKGHGHTDPPRACTHCGSRKHDDRGCWKRLTCQKCGRKGHPSDKCFDRVYCLRRDARRRKMPDGRIL
ncbi:unnamed protein product [Peronospora effusa]|nr:unnamed protein product [Peronospora effusa]